MCIRDSASHPAMREHFAATNEVLEELQALDKPLVLAFNKCDLLAMDTVAMDPPPRQLVPLRGGGRDLSSHRGMVYPAFWRRSNGRRAATWWSWSYWCPTTTPGSSRTFVSTDACCAWITWRRG